MTGGFYLALLAPILDESDANRPLGVLALRIDPEIYLYPFIKRWPTPSLTAETLLVRRDGNDVLYLNELKFGTNTALSLRNSLENTNMPAVKAVLGQKGVVEGADYRGVPVLAALHEIPDSPWSLVAKMDRAEVYAPLRERLRLTLLLVGLLLISAGAGIGAIWWHQRVRLYRVKYEAEADRANLSAIVESSEDAIISKNLDGTITSWNAGAERLFGYRAGEMIGQPVARIIPPGSQTWEVEILARVRRGESVEHYETVRIAKDGRPVDVSLTISPIRNTAGAIIGASKIARDITGRKRAEEELRNSRALYFSLVENLPQSVFRKDRAGRFQFVNERFCRDLRRSAEDIIGRTDADFFPPELAQAYRKDDLRVMETGQILDQEEKHVSADGRELFVHVLKTPLRDAQGQIVGVQGVFWDVTERKRAEEALHYEQTLTATLMENLPDAVYFKDVASRFLRVNRAMSRKFGLSDPAQLVGKSDADFFSGEHARKALADEQEIVRTGQPLLNVEEKETWLDGPVSWVVTTKLPLRDAAGRIIGTCGISHDITDRKRAEEKVARTAKEWQMTFDATKDAIWILDENHRVLRTNKMAESYFKRPCSEMIGKPCWEIVHGTTEPIPECPFVRARQSRHRETMDLQQGERWLAVTVDPILDAAGQYAGAVHIVSDITERKRAEEALQESEARYQRISEAITDYIYIVRVADGRAVETTHGPGCQAVTGYRTEEFANDSFLWLRMVVAEDRPLVEEQARRILAGEDPPAIEHRIVHKNGAERWVRNTFVPHRDERGALVSYDGLIQDITERKQAEMALRESDIRYRTLFGESTDGILIADIETKTFKYANPALCRMLGYTEEELQTMGLPDIHPKDAVQSVAAEFEAQIRGDKTLATDISCLRKDGSVFQADINAVKMTVDGRPCIVGFFRDITERKRTDQDREQALQRQQGISRLHESLLESRPLRDKLQLVTETIVRLFDADFCRIWLTQSGDLCAQGCMHAQVKKGPHACRHREMCLHLLASAGRYTHLDGAGHRRVPFGAYKIGLIAAGKEAKFLINNVQQEPLVHDRKWAKELGLVSFAGYRLQSPGGTPLGVLALFAKRPLTAQEDLLLEGLSNATTSVLLTQRAEDQTRQELAERKRAEEALRESEERYRTMMEQAADAVFLHDGNGRILDVNRKACQSLGYSREELLAKSIKDIDPEAIQAGKHGLWGKILAGEHVTFESRQMRKDGSFFPVEVTLGSVRLQLGPVILGLARDITERKRAEEALRDSEEKFRSLFNNAAVGMFRTRLDGAEFLDVNGKYLSILGRTREEVVGKPSEILWADPKEREEMIKILKAKGRVNDFECRLLNKAGTEINCLTSLRLYPETGILEGSIIDITERKRAEQALLASEAELLSILESTGDGILAVDRNGERVIKANRRYAEMWRIPQSIIDAGDNNALRNFVLNQLSDPDAFLKRVHELYNTDKVAADTLAFKDGRVFERHGFPMMLAGAVTGRVWSFRDITERKRQERELSEKSSELERFTYTVSHDLKSPLVTVKTFLGYLEQDLLSPDKKEQVEQDVTYMRMAADKMGHLLDELLNLARVGRKVNPPVRATFQELAREAVGLVAGRISTSHAEVQVAEAAVVLEGDRPRLVEIWQNLVENACKFMADQPKPRVEIGVEKRGAETVFFVRDNGAGIEPRYHEKVFSLFEKLNPKIEGTGMGLALVKRVVEFYKGRIWVESDGPGRGANFLFTLPAAVIMEAGQSS